MPAIAGAGNPGLLKNEGRLTWPVVLRGPQYQEERNALNDLTPAAYDQAVAGKSDAETLNQMTTAVRRLQDKLKGNIQDLTTTEYREGWRFLSDFEAALILLRRPGSAAISRTRRPDPVGRLYWPSAPGHGTRPRRAVASARTTAAVETVPSASGHPLPCPGPTIGFAHPNGFPSTADWIPDGDHAHLPSGIWDTPATAPAWRPLRTAFVVFLLVLVGLVGWTMRGPPETVQAPSIKPPPSTTPATWEKTLNLLDHHELAVRQLTFDYPASLDPDGVAQVHYHPTEAAAERQRPIVSWKKRIEDSHFSASPRATRLGH